MVIVSARCDMRHVILATAVSVLVACSKGSPGGGSGGDGGPGTPTGWMSTSGGSFAATSDGLHFVQRSSPSTQDLFSIVCVGHQLGWAAGGRGTILSTSNGGASWRVLPTPTMASLRAIAFADPWHGVAVGAAGAPPPTAGAGSARAA